MSDEQRLNDMLSALRTADADRGASPFAETRLRAAFREHYTAPVKKRRSAAWLQTLLASAAVALVALVYLRTPPATAVKTAPPPKVAVAMPHVAEATLPVPVVARPTPKVRRKATAPARRVAAAPPPAAAEEPFVMLPYAPPLHARDWGQVMRVRVPRQSLRSLGLPLNEERIGERVPADLLLGEDGVPRAIRVVNTAF